MLQSRYCELQLDPNYNNRAVQFVVILKPGGQIIILSNGFPWEILLRLWSNSSEFMSKIWSAVNIARRDCHILFYNINDTLFYFSKNPYLKNAHSLGVFLNCKLNRWHHGARHSGNFINHGELSQHFLLLLRETNGNGSGFFAFNQLNMTPTTEKQQTLHLKEP